MLNLSMPCFVCVYFLDSEATIGEYLLWTNSLLAASLALVFVAWKLQEVCLQIREEGTCDSTLNFVVSGVWSTRGCLHKTWQ
jgi:hypothetical protein